MNWTPELRDFIQCHLNDDTAELLLAARRYQGVDVSFAVEQIEARRRLRGKLPVWHANPNLVMGGRVPAEQCSSEATARYKRSIVEGQSLCDMTGGMGVDFWHLSEGMERAVYTERNERLCEVARHNFLHLADGRHPVAEIRCGNAQALPVPTVDVIYLDPARRADDGSRVYVMEDCEPNVVEWQDDLLQHAKTVLVKLSPMVDLTDVVRKLRYVSEVHVVAVKNECKEVLVKMERTATTVTLHCVDFLSASTMRYTATFPDGAAVLLTDRGVGRYLYEPDVTLMKAQAFGCLCQYYSVRQLAGDTHLMTSDQCLHDFPGRVFLVEQQMPLTSKTLKSLKRTIPQANIATRNFSFTADQLRRKTGIKDGGQIYLFGAKVKGEGDVLVVCRKVD